MNTLDACTNTRCLASCDNSSCQHLMERQQQRKKRRLRQMVTDMQPISQVLPVNQSLSSGLASADTTINNPDSISLSSSKPVLSSSGILSFLIQHTGGLSDPHSNIAPSVDENYMCSKSASSEPISTTKMLSIPLLLDVAPSTQDDLLSRTNMFTTVLMHAAVVHIVLAMLETSLIASLFTRPMPAIFMLPVVWSLCLSFHAFCCSHFPSGRFGCLSWLISASAHMLLCFTMVLLCFSSWSSTILLSPYGHIAVTIVSLSATAMSIMITSIVLHRYIGFSSEVELHQQQTALGSKFAHFRSLFSERLRQRQLRRQQIQQLRVKQTAEEIV